MNYDDDDDDCFHVNFLGASYVLEAFGRSVSDGLQTKYLKMFGLILVKLGKTEERTDHISIRKYSNLRQRCSLSEG